MVRYQDADNDPPTTGYPKVEVKRNGSLHGQFSMNQVDTEDTIYSNGKDYILIMPMGNTSLNYEYRFIAWDTQGREATGNPVTFRSSPRITEAPTFSWSQRTTDFMNRGVDKTSGSTGWYRFEVKYQSSENYAPYTNNPVVHIAIGGKEVSGSPFSLLPYDGSTNYITGKIYYQNVSLAIAADYTYWFTTYNMYNVPGVGVTMTGPAVIGSNLAPTLSYQGTGSFNTDGVDPDYGTPGATFKFRVKYTDQNNHSPQGTPTITIQSKTYLMDSIVEGNLSQAAQGIVYEKSLELFTVTSYSYAFNATDTVGAKATTLSKTGPAVNNAPTLSGGTVTPTSGAAGSVFTFKVTYTDQDNNAPYNNYPKVHIAIGEKEISGSPFAMAYYSGSSYITGKVYSKPVTLSTASNAYSYWFEAKDVYQLLGNVATGIGPTVSGSNIAPQFTSGTVTPYVGTIGTEFTFSAKYTDANNDEPETDCPKMVLKGSNGTIIGTYSATGSDTQTPAQGRTYSFGPIDFMGTWTDDYSYCFTAYDMPYYGSTLSVTTAWVVGPIVTGAPVLSNGTVTGSVDIGFTFAVEYLDDGGLPTTGYPRVFLK
ncbi:MAG: hypothetical protein AAB296_03240, partial [Candidatus Desantisbacteria bacterium]